MNKAKCKLILLKEENDFSIYKVSLEVPMNLGWIDNVNFHLFNRTYSNIINLKHIVNENGYSLFEAEVELPTSALYHDYFSFSANGISYFVDKDGNIVNNLNYSEMNKFSVHFSVPSWFKGSVMYHIFVDKFNRGSDEPLKPMNNRTIYSSFDDDMLIGPDENKQWNIDYYGGDLKGIISKLDYIKSLGVNVLYLSPIMWSQSNHRYDTSDYELVDPYAGDNDDLKKLCDEAHKLDIKVVLDAVFNHTGNDSKYFNEFGNFDSVGAYNNLESKYASFYRKHQDNGKTVFDYWWGFKNLPECDGNSKDWQQYIYGEGGIIDLWFSFGIDGLRLDVADELTDEFIEGIRKACKRNKEDSVIIGEVWKNPMSMNRGYLDSGKGMCTVMNYFLVDALIRYLKYKDVNKLKTTLNEILMNYPEETIYSLMNFTSTHDISRAVDIFGTDEFNEYSEWAWNLKNDNLEYIKNYVLSKTDYEEGKKVFKLYLFILCFLPGVLSIFYGDEVGIDGLGNLQNRKPFPWGNIDSDLLDTVKYVGQIRNNEEFLKDARLIIDKIDDRIFEFDRIGDNESIHVVVNRSDEEIEYNGISFSSSNSKVYSLNGARLDRLTPLSGIAIKNRSK